MELPVKGLRRCRATPWFIIVPTRGSYGYVLRQEFAKSPGKGGTIHDSPRSVPAQDGSSSFGATKHRLVREGGGHEP